jgi:hypothetical protein
MDPVRCRVASFRMPRVTRIANVANIGDEAFDSPPGPLQYVLYLRKGEKGASLTTYVACGGKATVLTMDQLRQLGAVVASRL